MGKIIDNRVGEPDEDFIPPHVLPGFLGPELRNQAIITTYKMDRAGMPETLAAVAADFNHKNNSDITSKNITMTFGARSALTHAAEWVAFKYKHIHHPRVLLMKPGYNLYEEEFQFIRYESDEVDLKNAKTDDEKLALIRKSLRADTLFLPICSPNNPTGEIYSEYFLRGILKLMGEFPQLHIANDSVYDRVLRDISAHPTNIFVIASPEERKRIFHVNSLSKLYSYPAIRAGWLIADSKVMADLQPRKDAAYGPLNNIAQAVCIAAVRNTLMLTDDYFEQVNNIYDRRLKLVHEKLHQIESFKSEIPGGTFYYWADFSGSGISAEEIIADLKSRNILVAEGAKFGDPDSIRINCGAKAKVLATICDNIVEICAEKGLRINQEKIRIPAKNEDLPEFARVTAHKDR